MPRKGEDNSAFRGNSALGIAILTVSDTRTQSDDKSGQLLAKLITNSGHKVAAKAIVPDEKPAIAGTLTKWLKTNSVDVILATGGTGFTARDITPEVFATFYEKHITGFGELFRQLSYAKIGASTIQSRASGGVAKGKYLFCLPGSPSACSDAWNQILEPQLNIRTKPCNLVSLLPRLAKK